MNYKSIKLENYNEQLKEWPEEGKHILAQYDEETIIVYQAYRPEIGLFAVENQYFGGEFSLSRMSWIKPNFLWMMYRCDWARSKGQEIVLAIRLYRSFFDEVLRQAIPSTFDSLNFSSNEEWKSAVQNSNVRLQWDPDHDPAGDKCIRRAIQLGLRDEMLRQYSREAIVEIINMSELITEQRENIISPDNLYIPKEITYQPSPGNYDNIKLTS